MNDEKHIRTIRWDGTCRKCRVKTHFITVKEKTIDNEFSLQRLVNRSLNLFVYDKDMREKILEHDNLFQSGSKF